MPESYDMMFELVPESPLVHFKSSLNESLSTLALEYK